MYDEAPTQNIITAWKDAYGAVYLAQLPDGSDCYFRPLTVGEYHKLTSDLMTSVEAEEMAVFLAVLYPKINIEEAQAGIISALAEDIFLSSRFGSPTEAKELLDSYRKKIEQTVTESMKAFVIAGIPSYKPEELDKLPYFQLVEKVALAEQVLRVQQASFGLEGQDLLFTIIDLEEEARKSEAEEKKRRKIEKEKVDRWIKEGGVQFNPEAPVLQPKIAADDPVAQKLFGGR